MRRSPRGLVWAMAVLCGMLAESDSAFARIVVGLQPNTLVLPSGQGTAAPEAMSFIQPVLLDTLDVYQVSAITEVLPDDGLPTDSTVVTALGDTVHLYVPRRIYYVDQDSDLLPNAGANQDASLCGLSSAA